jgi:hypothetical protein
MRKIVAIAALVLSLISSCYARSRAPWRASVLHAPFFNSVSSLDCKA